MQAPPTRLSPAASPRTERAAIAEEIERLYRVVYGRPADPDGLASFSAQRRAGTALVDLAAEFVNSSEFADKAAGRDPVAVLCSNALGRPPGPALAAASPAVAAATLVGDPEVVARLGAEIATGRSDPAARLFIKAEIDRLYRIVYGRAADPEGLDAFADQVADGRTLVTLAAECLRSDEFAARAAGRPSSAVLWAHAGKPGVPPDPAMPPDALAEALVRDPDVAGRLPVLPALFPDGVPLDDPWAYRFWLAETQRPAAPVHAGPDDPPVLSVMTFLDAPEVDALDAMVVSVRAQTVPGAELLIMAAQPLDPAVARMVERHTSADPRVRLCRPRAWPFQAPVQGALKLCRGTFVTCLDQHDTLDAITAATLATSADGADIIVADGDTLDGDGQRCAPRLTAAWDPDDALAAPPTGFVAIRASRLAAVRLKQRIGLDRLAWDLLLQAAADLPRERVRHLPAVLVSRARPEAPPRPGDFIRLADAHLRATRQTGSTAAWDAEAATVRIRRPLPATAPLASVIIPTRDRADLLRACLDGLLHRTDYPRLEVLVVDNESRDPATHRLLAELGGDGRVRVLPVGGDFNWSRLNNLAVREMQGEVAVLLNNDTEVVDPGWLREMVAQALRPEIGAVGAKLLYPDGRIQHAGVVLGPNGSATHAWRYADGGAAGYMGQLRRVRRVSAVTGACLALRRTVFDEVGGLDEKDLQVAWNDVDLCLKITAAGYDVLWTPYTTMLHIEQASRGSDERPAAKRRLQREQDHMRERWGARVDRDPWFSPLLALSEDAVRLSVRV